LGVSVDFNDANVAWAEDLGLTYPLLSDLRRQVSKSYDVLFDDPAMANDPQKIAAYLRSKRAFFVIDKEGVVRFAKVTEPRDTKPPTDDMLKVIKDL
jgi:peroxiredoxin